MSKVSVVIPIYNVEDYLKECLDSIIQQSYKNLEIILINDGSTDNCKLICEKYRDKDQRVILINQNNKGLSHSRNEGMALATGEYISFVDSDDIIQPSMISDLVKIAKENNADIVACDYFTKKRKYKITQEEQILQYTPEDSLKALIEVKIAPVVWNKIYSRSLIHKIKFQDYLHEDEFWTFQVLGQCQKLITTSKQLYYYRPRTGSLINKEYSLKRLDALKAFEERINYLQANYPQLVNLAYKHYFNAGIWHYYQIRKNISLDSQNISKKNIVHKIKSKMNLKTLNYLSLKEKINLLTFLISPKAYFFFREILHKNFDT